MQGTLQWFWLQIVPSRQASDIPLFNVKNHDSLDSEKLCAEGSCRPLVKWSIRGWLLLRASISTRWLASLCLSTFQWRERTAVAALTVKYLLLLFQAILCPFNSLLFLILSLGALENQKKCLSQIFEGWTVSAHAFPVSSSPTKPARCSTPGSGAQLQDPPVYLGGCLPETAKCSRQQGGSESAGGATSGPKWSREQEKDTKR